MPLNGPKQDIGEPQAAPGYDLNGYALKPRVIDGPKITPEPVPGPGLDERLSAAQERDRKHNAGDHSDCPHASDQAMAPERPSFRVNY